MITSTTLKLIALAVVGDLEASMLRYDTLLEGDKMLSEAEAEQIEADYQILTSDFSDLAAVYGVDAELDDRLSCLQAKAPRLERLLANNNFSKEVVACAI